MPVTEDFLFTNSDLEQYDGKTVLKVRDVFPGGFTVVDNNNRVVMPDQMELVNGINFTGVAVIFDGWLEDGMLPGTWRIRYNRGMRGVDGLSAQLNAHSSEELMLYSMIFG